jgi:MFS superfamily sulfate permease-like transporter
VIAVIGAILASYFLNLQQYGVLMVGPVPRGLPKFSLPQASLSWEIIHQLLPIAFTMFIVILTQSAATSRAYATRYNERFSENTDLIGLTLANLSAGLTGTFVVNGSPTKTEMVDSAGGHSQLAQVTTCAVVLIVLLFMTRPLAYMPDAVLATVVFLVGLMLIDIKGMRRILKERPVEFGVALITAAVVVFIGVEQGILLAILISLLAHTRHGYSVKNWVLVEQSGHYRWVAINNPAQALPGLIIYRFNHSMYYANAEQLSQQVLNLLNVGPEPLKWLCIDMVAVDDVDFSAAVILQELCRQLRGQDTQLVFSEVSDPIRAELDRSGITDLVGADAYYSEISDVFDSFRQHIGAS